MKAQASFLFIIALFFTNIGICSNASYQTSRLGRLVGIVTNTTGRAIYLYENHSHGIYSISAYVKQDGKYVPENVFMVKKRYQSTISSVKYDSWFSSNPDGGFFQFDKTDKALYIPLIDENMFGADRYIIYRFDGKHFIYKGKDGGFWLNQSLRNYDVLFALGRTKDFIVRIDRMSDGSCRYAAWSSNKTMRDKPSIILYNDNPFCDDGVLCFFNGDFKYIFDYDKCELRVYKGTLLIRCQKMSVVYL
jgi:hypothetical protein